MRETLREKLENSREAGLAAIPVCRAPGDSAVGGEMGIVVDHVDALAASLDTAIDARVAAIRCVNVRLDKLERDLATLAGADVPIKKRHRVKQDETSGMNAIFGSVPDEPDLAENTSRNDVDATTKIHLPANDAFDESDLKALSTLPKTFKDIPYPEDDEPDLEGEAMTPDYEAMKEDANEPDRPWRGKTKGYNPPPDDLSPPKSPPPPLPPSKRAMCAEPDRPWREAAEACWEKIKDMSHTCLGWTIVPSALIAVIESAIEKAVESMKQNAEYWQSTAIELRSERKSLKRRVQELQQQYDKLVLDCARHASDVAKERDALNAKAERLKSKVDTAEELIHQRIVELTDALGVPRHTLHWDGAILRVQELKDDVAGLETKLSRCRQSAQNLEERFLSQHTALMSLKAKLDETHDAHSVIVSNLRAELERLKAAKPNVVRLTREELEECWRTTRVFTFCTCGSQHEYRQTILDSTIDAVLALQERKAKEMEARDGEN